MLPLLAAGRRDVANPRQLTGVSQSVIVTQPLPPSIGSLGRVHHPMRGWSCHHVMKVMLDAPGGPAHFELFACDLVIDDGLTAHLMEVIHKIIRRD